MTFDWVACDTAQSKNELSFLEKSAGVRGCVGEGGRLVG